jgi:hypothetical protein
MFTRTKTSLIGSLAMATVAAAVGWWFDRQVLLAFLIVVGMIGIWHLRVIAALWLRFMDKRHYSQDQLDLADYSLKPRGAAQHSAIALYWTWTRIKQVSPTEAPALLGFFAIALIVLLTIRTDILEFDQEFFKSNIVPEIFGFLLDGLLVLGMLGYWAKKKSAKENEALRKVLKAFLWKYARHAAFTLELSDNPTSLVESPYASYRILNNFHLAWGLADSSQRKKFSTSVAKMAQLDVEAAMAMLTVAATLGSELAEVWIRVIASLRKIKDSEEKSFVHAFIDLLGAILELDDRSLLLKNPKLNIQQLGNLR